MTAKEHNKILSILLLAMGGLKAIGGIIVAFMYSGIGVFALTAAKKQEDQIMGSVFIFIGIVVGFFIILFSIVDLIAGWQLLKEKANGRIWGIVASILSLTSIPFGTALGVYGLWFLFGEVGKNFYLANDVNRDMFNPPPPPQNWA